LLAVLDPFFFLNFFKDSTSFTLVTCGLEIAAWRERTKAIAAETRSLEGRLLVFRFDTDVVKPFWRVRAARDGTFCSCCGISA
jgi:hypothetical protein